jgi:hypothetical protein
MLARRGQVRGAALFLTWAPTLGFTVRLLLSDRGVHTPFFMLYGLFALVAGMAMSRRSGMRVAGWGVLVGLGMTVAEALGVKSAPLTEIPLFMFLAANSFVLIVTAILFYMALGNFEHSLAQVQRANQESQVRALVGAACRGRTATLRRGESEATAECAVASELDMEECLAHGHAVQRLWLLPAGIFCLTPRRWAELHAAYSEVGRVDGAGHRLGGGVRMGDGRYVRRRRGGLELV